MTPGAVTFLDQALHFDLIEAHHLDNVRAWALLSGTITPIESSELEIYTDPTNVEVLNMRPVHERMALMTWLSQLEQQLKTLARH